MSKEAMTCEHDLVTSTFAKGPHCANCGHPLVSVFNSTSRNTPAGEVLYALRCVAEEDAHGIKDTP